MFQAFSYEFFLTFQALPPFEVHRGQCHLPICSIIWLCFMNLILNILDVKKVCIKQLPEHKTG